ncbi:hypothetical protein GCM10027445_18970 [Amycolatopsis endophytica]
MRLGIDRCSSCGDVDCCRRAEIVLVVGSEKLTHEDKARTFAALGSAVDLERLDEVKAGPYEENWARAGNQSFFMDVYAHMATTYMKESGPPKTTSPRWPPRAIGILRSVRTSRPLAPCRPKMLPAAGRSAVR